ncbi:hypothetical protein L6164_026004 [Bauhinia variegata]|uniref:Uncharacterized protein n=1 Tax=Bauhinia variegata TaxID=167791 RepID=A0ACB9M404_BAUVA|nr:hypothetical protein L6164_026004 [Bauhinia variegata]
MAFQTRFCFCFCIILAFFLVCSARNQILFADHEGSANIVGRSLKMSLDDYSAPTANRGHDPTRNRAGAGNGGRKG